MKKIFTYKIPFLLAGLLVLGLFVSVAYAINSWDSGYQVSNGETKQAYVAGTTDCHTTINNNGNAIFVPTKTVAEWNAFASHLPAGVSVGSCAGTAPCTLPWGGTLAHGSSTAAYFATSVPCGSTCSSVSQTRTCNNGTLSGTYTNKNCSVVASLGSCNLPWGGCIADGGAVWAYSTTSVACGYFCMGIQETRFCNSGVLSGSYTNGTCSMAPCVNFGATPNPVSYGAAATLSWSTLNMMTPTAASCWASGDWTGWKSNGSGSESTGALTAGKTYNLECWNSAGVSSGIKSINVSVNTFTCGVSTVSGKAPDTNIYGTMSYNGRCWLDRNLGATQVATSKTDESSYGWVYQWGRATDGHQLRFSGTTITISSTDIPGHGNFIKDYGDPYDWRSPQNPNLWQGVSGVNNPCPTGFRLPTAAEANLGFNDAEDAFAKLKLPVAGYRYTAGGTITGRDFTGYYWTSSVIGIYSQRLTVEFDGCPVYSSFRANGLSVRCLKD